VERCEQALKVHRNGLAGALAKENQGGATH
jgi:hypothetical protein